MAISWPRPINFLVGQANHTPEHNLINEHLNALHQATERILYGTGNPNGQIVAPIGTTFRNTEVGGYNGARVWRKDSGTFSTGWVVESGDTGWRDAASSLLGGWEPFPNSPVCRMRRIGAEVLFQARLIAGQEIVGARNGSTSFFETPLGFSSGQYIPLGVARSSTPPAVGVVEIAVSSAKMDLYFPTASGSWAEGDRANIAISYPTDQAWPATLPG